MNSEELEKIDPEIIDELIMEIMSRYKCKGYVLLFESENKTWKQGYWNLDKLNLLDASSFLKGLYEDDLKLDKIND